MRSVRLPEIIDTVAEVVGLPVSEMLTVSRGGHRAGRTPKCVLARYLACHIAYSYRRWSFPELAAALGFGSHSTAMFARSKGALLEETDEEFGVWAAKARRLIAERYVRT